MEIEEDFAALRESFTSLRQSIQQELMSRTEPLAAAPVQRPVVPGLAPSIHPVGEEAFGGQFSALREQLMGGWAASSACSSRLHGSTRITSNPPVQPLPHGMGFEVRGSPAKVDRPHEDQPTALPLAPEMVSMERTSVDTVVLNAPKPGRAGGTSLLAATEAALFSAPARSQAAQPYKHEDSAADVAKQYRVRAEVLRSATNTAASGLGLQGLYVTGGDGVVFGHLAMRAALESHRRHYAEARSALRPDGSKLQPAAQMQTASAPPGVRKPTEPRSAPALAPALVPALAPVTAPATAHAMHDAPRATRHGSVELSSGAHPCRAVARRGPSLATAGRSRVVRSAFGSTVTPHTAGGGPTFPSALPPGCEATMAGVASVLPPEELSRLHDRIGAQRAVSAGSFSARAVVRSARPSSAKGKQRTVPLIAATAR